MTRPRSSSRPPAAADAPASGASAAATAEAGSHLPWIGLLALIGTLAWLRIFTTWFAQDDFHWLLRAVTGGTGVFDGHPAWVTPRALSMWSYFRLWHALFGLEPWAYHALSLILHLVSGVLLYAVLARRLPRGIAAAAAALVLTSPALFDALHWISGIADLMCAAFLAVTVWLVSGPSGARRWLSVATYGLALASKEIAVGALPVLVVLHLRRGGRTGVLRVALCAALAALFALNASHAWETGPGGAYAWKPAALLLNLPAFAAVALAGGAAFAEPADLLWSRLPWVQVLGWAVLAAWLVALVLRRSAGAWLGAAWFLGLLAPVAMLERQFQFYYLCCALPGLAASLAFLAAGLPPSARRQIGWAAVVLVAAQVLCIEWRSAARLRLAPLPTDFVLRRAQIARNAIGDLKRAPGPIKPRLVMLGQQPVDAAWQGRSTTEATDYTRDPWWDENVRGALSNGEAITLMLPDVQRVEFQSYLDPADTASTIAGYHIDGHLTVADYRGFVGMPLAGRDVTLEQRLQHAGELIERRLFREALAELTVARGMSPDNPDVLVNLGALQVNLGDSTQALATLGRAIEVAPGDMDARYNLGLLQWRLGRKEEARATWAPLLAKAPGSDLARAVTELMAGRAR